MSRIGLIGRNSIEYVNTLLDIWNAGDCAVLIDPCLPYSKQQDLLRLASATKCYYDIESANFSQIDNEIAYIPYKSDSEIEIPGKIYAKFQNRYSHDEAVILFSSGTTGDSKGVIMSHFAINTNADSIIEYMNLHSNDCFCVIKQLNHSSTLVGELVVALKTQTRMLIPQTLFPKYIFTIINRFKVSIICLNPTLLHLFTQYQCKMLKDISSLRIIYVSGSILTDSMYKKAHETFKTVQIFNVYGQTETGPRITAQTYEHSKSNSVGQPIHNVRIKIVLENGREAPQYCRGLVYVSTPSLYSGYISDFNKKRSIKNGWHNTGDIGFIDSNDELHIVGRNDDLLTINSTNVYPSDIENILLSINGINQCVVVKSEQDGYDFLVCLYTGEDIDTTNTIRLLNEQLMPHEIPKKFIRVEELPLTTTGKICRQKAKLIIDNKNYLEKCNESGNNFAKDR